MEIDLLNSYNYWSKKRIYFNAVLVVVGVGSLLFFNLYMSFTEIVFGSFLWGLVANGLFSFGYVLESYIITKTNGNRNLKESRDFLFVIGTTSYAIASIAYVFFIAMLPLMQG